MRDSDTTPHLPLFLVDPWEDQFGTEFRAMALGRGLEVHFVRRAPFRPWGAFLETLTDSFPGSPVLAFLPRGGDWAAWADELRDLDLGGLRLGVAIGEPSDPAEALNLRQTFLWDLGLAAGCLALGDCPQKNRRRVLQGLEALASEGDRPRWRMTPRSPVLVPGTRFRAVLSEVGPHRLVLDLEAPAPDWAPGTWLRNLDLDLGGTTIQADAEVVGRWDDEGGGVRYLLRADLGLDLLRCLDRHFDLVRP